MGKVKQTISIIPSLFTLGNAFFGFLAIANAIDGNIDAACYYIFFGMACDALDGLIARLFKTTSRFGIEVDSLADVVTFGMAPSVIVYQVFFDKLGLLGIFFASLPMIFAIIRLAKFNVTTKEDEEKKMFSGIPTPVSAGTLVTYVLFYHNKIFTTQLSTIVMFTLVIALPLLMVSTFKYDTFPQFNRRAIKANPAKFIIFFLAVFLIIITKGEASFSVFLFIISTGIFRKFVSIFTKKEDGDEEVELEEDTLETEKEK
ncbi:MAG: CDP-diacylglycerol--serine O-phosphatidyltransferase [Ignavibacteriae bacterium]|nr:CDP-diacylglycerol--serine O-phosphatidyltransferase [Ignavibacteriota bacterium]MCB9244264.1 CDP-diacylglycerol--serine O-phosphatidyltransferase [Ignavibacteriales bacterium]